MLLVPILEPFPFLTALLAAWIADTKAAPLSRLSLYRNVPNPRQLPVSGCSLLLLSAIAPKLEKKAVTFEKLNRGSKPVTTTCVGGPGPYDVLGSQVYGLRRYGESRSRDRGLWKSVLI